jgi:hypothetical protein
MVLYSVSASCIHLYCGIFAQGKSREASRQSSILYLHAVCSKSTDVSEEPVSYIFRVEDLVKQETSMKQIERRLFVTRRHIPEEGTVNNHRCENSESHT